MLVEDRYNVDLLQYDQKVCELANRAGADVDGCTSTATEPTDEETTDEESTDEESTVSYSFQDELNIVGVGGHVLEGQTSGFTHKLKQRLENRSIQRILVWTVGQKCILVGYVSKRDQNS